MNGNLRVTHDLIINNAWYPCWHFFFTKKEKRNNRKIKDHSVEASGFPFSKSLWHINLCGFNLKWFYYYLLVKLITFIIMSICWDLYIVQTFFLMVVMKKKQRRSRREKGRLRLTISSQHLQQRGWWSFNFSFSFKLEDHF